MASTTKTEGYVETPPTLAWDIVREYTDIHDGPVGQRVLEPSAGTGSLVRAVFRLSPYSEVWAVEPHRERATQITVADHPGRTFIVGPGHARDTGPNEDLTGSLTVVCGSFEEFAGSVPGWFDQVVMNPPFAKPGEPTLWALHVAMAWSMLRPGGRLVAIVPGSITWRQEKRHNAIRKLVEATGGYRELPDGSFSASGTDAKAAVIWATKPTKG